MPRYQLIAEIDDDDDIVVCSFDVMTGFFDSSRTQEAWLEVDILIEDYASGAGLPLVTGKHPASVRELRVLGADGAKIGEYYFLDSRTDLSADGLRCEALVGGHAPLPEEEEIWELVRAGGPTVRNLWAGYGVRGRRAWVQVALNHHVRTDGFDRPSGSTFEMDGAYVTESIGFYCALGEAINGPGGYYGIGLDSLADCMCGGYGTSGGFTLVWRDFEVARRSWRPGPFPDASLGRVLDLLTMWGVEVVRA